MEGQTSRISAEQQRRAKRASPFQRNAAAIAAQAIAGATEPVIFAQGNKFAFEVTQIRVEATIKRDGQVRDVTLEAPAMIARPLNDPGRALIVSKINELPDDTQINTLNQLFKPQGQHLEAAPALRRATASGLINSLTNLLRPQEQLQLAFGGELEDAMADWRQLRQIPIADRERFFADNADFPSLEQLEEALRNLVVEEKSQQRPLSHVSLFPAQALVTTTQRTQEGDEAEIITTDSWKSFILECCYDRETDTFSLVAADEKDATENRGAAFAASACRIAGSDLTRGWSGEFVSELQNEDGSSYSISPPGKKPPGRKKSVSLTHTASRRDMWNKPITSTVVIDCDDLTAAINCRAAVMGQRARTKAATAPVSSEPETRNLAVAAIISEINRQFPKDVNPVGYDSAGVVDLAVKLRSDYGVDWEDATAKISWSSQAADRDYLRIAVDGYSKFEARVALDDLLQTAHEAFGRDGGVAYRKSLKGRGYRFGLDQPQGETGKPNFMQIGVGEKLISFDLYDMARIAARADHSRKQLLTGKPGTVVPEVS